MKILIAEDDKNILNGLVELCREEGYETCAAENGKQALELFQDEMPDFLLLDIMMPSLSGYDVCREIRKTDRTIPIIFISAKSEEIDKVLGLELGADDYISKPFGVREVVARIRAVTRRCLAARPVQEQQTSFVMDDLEISPDELRARRDGQVIDLSLRDVAILQLLYENRGKALHRDALFNAAWGLDHLPNSRTLDQHISQLRKRIERDPKNPCIIATVHAVGYRYDE